MSFSYEYIKKLNKEWVDHPFGNKLHIVKESNKYFITCPSFEGSRLELNNIGDIYELLNDMVFSYFDNLSILDNINSIIDNYLLTNKDWVTIRRIINFQIDKQMCGINKFSIIKIDNLEYFLAKITLLGHNKILYKTPFYALILSNNNITLVSDLNLSINDDTVFNFQDLPCSYINIDNINTNNKLVGSLTSLEKLFYGCMSLTEVNLNNFNTKHIVNFSDMFKECRSLERVNIECIKTDNAVNMSGMFYGCSRLLKLDLNHFKVNNVSNFSTMFAQCVSLKRLKIEKWVLSDKKDLDCFAMFMQCRSLNGLNVSIFRKYLDSANEEVINSMFCETKYGGKYA